MLTTNNLTILGLTCKRGNDVDDVRVGRSSLL